MTVRSLPTRRHRGVARSRRPLRSVATLVPLTLVSSAWTVSLVSSPSASEVRVPGSPSVPTQAFDSPASVTSPARFSAVRRNGSGGVAAVVHASGVPTVAWSAYRRAARVINVSDPACHLDWSLLAGIGRVESDHGRHGDSVLRPDGISMPGIYGVRLDGRRGTTRIEDTDAGLHDHDDVFDRAVGPMQFIPTTWSDVGVDADGDGKRNPQDIDDASLAAAVYLCAGAGDLSTDAGQVAALLRYNHSRSYVRLVRSLAAGYAAGESTSVSFEYPSAVRLRSRQDDVVAGSGSAGGQGAEVAATSDDGGEAPDAAAPAPANPPAEPTPEPKPARQPLLAALNEVTEGGTATVLDTVSVITGLAGGLLSRP